MALFCAALTGVCCAGILLLVTNALKQDYERNRNAALTILWLSFLLFLPVTALLVGLELALYAIAGTQKVVVDNVICHFLGPLLKYCVYSAAAGVPISLILFICQDLRERYLTRRKK